MSLADTAINGSIVLGRKRRDREEFQDKFCGWLGRDLGGQFRVCIDFLRPHVGLICGKKGYGKSYTLGVLTEEFLSLDDEIRKNIALVIVDPMNIFWSLKMENIDQIESDELKEKWGLDKKSFADDVKVLVPHKMVETYSDKRIMCDEGYLLNPGELDETDWYYTFEIDPNSPMGLTLSLAISNLKEKYGDNFLIKHIVREIDQMSQTDASQQTKMALIRRFRSIQEWGIFVEENETATRIMDIVRPGKITVLNVSDIREDVQGGWGIRSLIVGLIARKIFEFRGLARKKELAEIVSDKTASNDIFPIVWMLIDEAHRFAPSSKLTAASLPLVNWARMGRQPGLSLFLATQRPGSLDMDILSQCDLILVHRLTAQIDIDALNRIRPTFTSGSILDHLERLPHDQAGYLLAIDDTTESVIQMKIRSRRSWHSGEDAIATRSRSVEVK